MDRIFMLYLINNFLPQDNTFFVSILSFKNPIDMFYLKCLIQL